MRPKFSAALWSAANSDAMMDRMELRTERLLLRPFQVGDVGDALAYRDDEEFARFLPHIFRSQIRSAIPCGCRSKKTVVF